MWTWHEATVVRTQNASSNTKRFWLEVPDLESIDFKPGQFITMDLPVHEKRQMRWRSYSIANEPDGSNLLELCIVRLDGGLATTYLFDEVRRGSKIRFKGPEGGFVLPETLDRPLVFICTGTGVAPFRSMLRHVQRAELPHGPLHLIFGTRYSDNILYCEEFEKMERGLQGFRFSVALSRETTEGPWHSGYVHGIYEAEYSDLSSARPLFYLCGWRNMVDEAKARLLAMGVPEQDIVLELYG
jgi:CDP-4-dehydro-6-deoxyglucose reductase